MALGSTQPLTEMSRAEYLITFMSHSLNLHEHPWPIQACTGIALPFIGLMRLSVGLPTFHMLHAAESVAK
jgi:hypothetical protein